MFLRLYPVVSIRHHYHHQEVHHLHDPRIAIEIEEVTTGQAEIGIKGEIVVAMIETDFLVMSVVIVSVLVLREEEGISYVKDVFCQLSSSSGSARLCSNIFYKF